MRARAALWRQWKTPRRPMSRSSLHRGRCNGLLSGWQELSVAEGRSLLATIESPPAPTSLARTDRCTRSSSLYKHNVPRCFGFLQPPVASFCAASCAIADTVEIIGERVERYSHFIYGMFCDHHSNHLVDYGYCPRQDRARPAKEAVSAAVAYCSGADWLALPNGQGACAIPTTRPVRAVVGRSTECGTSRIADTGIRT
jgi:hypothetical protein